MRKRVLLIALLLVIAFFANAIYADVVQYLTLKQKLQYLETVLIIKWLVIIFNSVFSIYLVLTIFKNTSDSEQSEKTKKIKQEQQTEPEFTPREQEFLKKKRLRSQADVLLDD